ncbi:shikimate dehydrogenase [Pseudooceanicola sp. HF7]|uniref:shikimate dehydrogenase n=1 Tax=Pseudooceanicola sp. HF7 TaxID=2721560 RepID=UPI0014309BC6|nr:shikimate dehydrogenase [Pseudooceanicola sp. HF7]NIZ09622.1 shikimate dehydrogenase [Pseudooceanicola sp. HF7]
MSSEKIPLAGVIGCPIGHSRSPQVHGYWLKELGLPGHYIPMEVRPEDLEEALRTLPKLGFAGINVTLPHKEAVLELASHVTDRASLIGAANTLIFREDGSFHADNTDGYGFIENLRQNAPGWEAAAGPAAVLGAGGAARAVVVALLDAGVPEVQIANRTKLRAERLQQDFGNRVKVVEWVHAGRMVTEAATVVNTTSLGMLGKPDLKVNLDGLRPEQVVTDIVYNPLTTPLLRAAGEAGCTVVDGLGMLLHQAVPGFERWFGAKPEVTPGLRAAALA